MCVCMYEPLPIDFMSICVSSLHVCISSSLYLLTMHVCISSSLYLFTMHVCISLSQYLFTMHVCISSSIYLFTMHVCISSSIYLFTMHVCISSSIYLVTRIAGTLPTAKRLLAMTTEKPKLMWPSLWPVCVYLRMGFLSCSALTLLGNLLILESSHKNIMIVRDCEWRCSPILHKYVAQAPIAVYLRISLLSSSTITLLTTDQCYRYYLNRF